MTPRNESSEIAQAFPGAVVDLYGGVIGVAYASWAVPIRQLS